MLIIIILIYTYFNCNDYRKKSKILDRIDYLLESSNFRIKRDFMEVIYRDVNFREETFYINAPNFVINNDVNFIDENRYNFLKQQLCDYFNNALYIKRERSLVANMIIKSNKNDLKEFLDRNYFELKELNTYNFDFLIYSITRNATNDIIKFILQYFYLNESLNYGV